MQRPGYERYALVANPFHDLASESLQQTELLHVLQEADDAVEAIKQEVLEKARKAFVVVVGPLGSGKTQRLRVTQGQAEQVGAHAFYLNLGEAPPDPVAAIAGGLWEAVQERKAAKGFTPPRWAKDLQAIAKTKSINPETAGRTLAEAMAALAPSYLLLNDLDAVPPAVEPHLLQTMLALVSHLQPGCMVQVACQAPHFARLHQRAGPLMSRIHRVLQLQGLGDAEAELLLAKRMAGRRLIDDLDPAYPFTHPAIAELNRAAGGSPRRLLQFADLVLDHAVRERAFSVTPELVQAALAKAPTMVGATPVTPAPASDTSSTEQPAPAPTTTPASLKASAPSATANQGPTANPAGDRLARGLLSLGRKKAS